MQELQTVRFGPYTFEPHNAQLSRGKAVLPLTRKACEVLQCLLAQPGQLVTKEALFAAVWPETVVSDRVLTNCIAELRQALGDDAQQPQYIATVHRRGYRFIAPLSPPASSPDFRPLVAPLPATARLVGREAELAHLHRLYTQALHGQRHVVFVTGEAGIGKTPWWRRLSTVCGVTPGCGLGMASALSSMARAKRICPC
jgi:DNA-binding winged helix-turn-helix (wHTH) protein